MTRKKWLTFVLALALSMSALTMGKLYEIPTVMTGDPVPGLDFYEIKGKRGYVSTWERREFGLGIRFHIRNDTGQVLRILDIESVYYQGDEEIFRYTQRAKAFPRRVSGLKNGRRGNFKIWQDSGQDIAERATRAEFSVKFIRLEGKKEEITPEQEEKEKKKRKGHRRKKTESGLYVD